MIESTQKSQAPKISVLMPAYNAEKYIGEAIESILKQSFLDFELIILDDSSSDETWKIISEYAAKDSRVGLFRNSENLGISRARNKLISLSKGKYIVWQDADDISMPYRLKDQYEFMEANHEVGICGGYLYNFEDRKDLGIRKYAMKDMDLRKNIFRYSPVAQPAAIVRKECFDKVGRFSLTQNVAEDLDMSFRIGTLYKFANLPKILIKYRQVRSGATFTSLKNIEIFTLETRKKYAATTYYKMNMPDKIYNFLQHVSIYIVPPRLKIWLFNIFRNSKSSVRDSKVTNIVMCQAFLPGGGGIENSVHQIMQEAIKINGMSTEIVTFEKDPTKTKEFDKTYNIPVFRIYNPFNLYAEYLTKNYNSIVGGVIAINFLGRLSMIFVGASGIIFLFVVGFKRIWANNGPIILTCFSLSAVFASKILKLCFPFRKIAIVFNNGFVYQKSKFWLMDIVIKKTLQSADYCMCISGASAIGLQKAFDLDKEKVIPYRTWIKFDRNVPIANRRTWEYTEKLCILFVGRIVPEKGIQEIIRLAEHIEKQNMSHKYCITVVGDSMNPIVKTLTEAAKTNECLKYVGWVNKPELWEYYIESDLFLMPSTWEEGSGNVILEATRFGLPVVGSNKGGIPEILKRYEYYSVIDDLNPEAMLESINDLWERMTRDGKKKVVDSLFETVNKDFSENNFAGHEIVFKKLINKFNKLICIWHATYNGKKVFDPNPGITHSFLNKYFKDNLTIIRNPLVKGGKTVISKNFGNGERLIEFRHVGMLPDPIRYIYETIFNFFYLLINVWNSRIFCIDPLSCFPAAILKKVGFVKEVYFMTPDFSKSRFSNTMLNYIYFKMDQFCTKTATVNICNSSSVIEYKKSQYPNLESSFFHMPNIPPPWVVEEYQSIPKKGYLIVYVGTLGNDVSITGFRTLFEAIAEISKKYPDTELRIIGEGNHKSELIDLAKNLAPRTNIVFTGQINFDEVQKNIACGEIGLAFYDGENTYDEFRDSLKIREYQAYGTIPLTTRVVRSNTEEIERQNSGVIIEKWERDSLISKVSEIFSNDSLRKTLSENAKSNYRMYSTKYDELRDLFEK